MGDIGKNYQRDCLVHEPHPTFPKKLTKWLLVLPINSPLSIDKANYALQFTHKLYVPYMDFIVPTITQLEDGKVRIELYTKDTNVFLGMLYYEKAKNGFLRKPVGLKKMACVDAKIETLFNLYPQVEPKDVLDFCQSLLDGGAKIQQNILPNNK